MAIFARNLSYQCFRMIQHVVVHYDNIEFALHRTEEKGQDTKFLDVH